MSDRVDYITADAVARQSIKDHQTRCDESNQLLWGEINKLRLNVESLRDTVTALVTATATSGRMTDRLPIWLAVLASGAGLAYQIWGHH